MDIFLQCTSFTKQYILEACLCCSFQWLHYIFLYTIDLTATLLWMLIAISTPPSIINRNHGY